MLAPLHSVTLQPVLRFKLLAKFATTVVPAPAAIAYRMYTPRLTVELSAVRQPLASTVAVPLTEDKATPGVMDVTQTKTNKFPVVGVVTVVVTVVPELVGPPVAWFTGDVLIAADKTKTIVNVVATNFRKGFIGPRTA